MTDLHEIAERLARTAERSVALGQQIQDDLAESRKRLDENVAAINRSGDALLASFDSLLAGLRTVRS